MKIIILCLTICILFSCEKKENSGYICTNGQCNASFENPTYLTLKDCQAECGTSGTSPTTPTQTKVGSVSITLNWTLTTYLGNITSGTTVLGLGYTSNDVANGAFFAEKSYIDPNRSTFTQSNLKVGIYYYKATRSYTSNDGSGPVSKKVEKSGSFTIESGKTTSITVNLN